MIGTPVVGDEFPQITVHVVQAPRVRLEGADWGVVSSGVPGVPSVRVQLGRLLANVAIRCRRVAETVGGRRASSAAILPLGFCGQANHFAVAIKLFARSISVMRRQKTTASLKFIISVEFRGPPQTLGFLPITAV